MKLALCHDSLKVERLMGLLPPARLVAHGDGFLRKRKQTRALYIFRFLRCFVYFISLDNFFLYSTLATHFMVAVEHRLGCTR